MTGLPKQHFRKRGSRFRYIPPNIRAVLRLFFYAAAQRAQKFASNKSGLRKLLLNLFRFDRLFAEPASLLR
jgi:hypothetical protein